MANFYGTSANDTATVSGLRDEAYGYDGDDQLTTSGDENGLYGGSDNDTLRATTDSSGNNGLFGESGDDTLIAEGTRDYLFGGDGRDTLNASGVDNRLNGDAGTDTLTATGQGNGLYGGTDNDILHATASSRGSGLFGDDGDDILSTEGIYRDALYGGAGLDTLSTSGTNNQLLGGVGADTLTVSGDENGLYGGSDNDILTATINSRGYNGLFGEDGDDTLLAQANNDVLSGGMGADILSTSGDDNQLSGDAGTDTLTVSGQGNTLYGGSENDTLRATTGSGGSNGLFGDAGDDTLIAEGDHDSLFGGIGSDTLSTSGSNNSLSGGDHDDILISTNGGNTLDGGAGNDRITSGTGSDTLLGGGGSDTFIFAHINQSTSSNPDLIIDFASGTDKIDVTGISASPVLYGNTTAGSNQLWYQQTGAQTDILIDTTGDGAADTLIRLNGTVNLTANDFIGLLTNTAPTANPIALSGNEDDVSIDGNVSGSDVDANPLTYAVSGATPTGVVFDQDGSFHYTPQAADQALDAGDSRQVTFDYVANDGTVNSAPQTVTITIDGANDAPVATDVSVSGSEDDASISGSVSATDVDVEALSYAVSGATPTALTFNSDGSFSYTPQAIDQALNVGQSREVIFQYVANDGTVDSAIQTVTITINGADDATSLSGDIGATVGEGGNPSNAPTSFTGQISIDDVDTSGLTIVADSSTGQYGQFSIDQLGQWRYQVDQSLAALQQLTASDTVQEHFTVQSSNGISQQITLTIQGSNAFMDNNHLNQYTGGSQDDIMYGYLGKDTLNGQQGNDSLYGGADQDTLIGGEGHDYLDGGTHIDTLIGGMGNDTYVVNTTLDKITELDNEGIDTVLSSDSYQLSANIENLTLTAGGLTGNGNNLVNTLNAHTLGSTLNGGGGNDNLNGNIGHDNLNGGTGSDVMTGGLGDDVYFVNGVGDQVVELAGEGTDTVYTLVSYALRPHVENVILMAADITAFGNVNANSITASLYGNTLDGAGGDDTLVGRQGHDILVGGSGKDLMIGAQGNDRYVVNTRGDRVVEFANEGHDTIESSISWTIEEHAEDLILTGSADSFAKGNTAANVITGNTGNNRLDGAGGLDRVIGGAGNDIYVLGRGYQQTEVVEASDSVVGGALDIVEFSAGIYADQVWFAQAGNDLQVSVIGTEANVLIKDWYSTGMGIEQFSLRDGQVLNANEVQQLVDQMAAFTPPPLGQTELTTEQFNALNSVINSTWGAPT